VFRLSCALAIVGLIACTSASHSSPAAGLRVSGTSFQQSSGEVFHWRGISAFRLVEMVAHGNRAEAAAFLDWAASRKLTVVRVFTMARHLFQLAPGDGVRALPELLQMAAARGLHVEVVALVDTADVATDIDAHVKAVGAIAARHANAVVEIANEPAHPTQAMTIHDPRELRRLAALVPAGVPVSFGSAEDNEAFAGGHYATFHFPRSGERTAWGHVLALAKGAALVKSWNKPVINDESIGAAATAIPGRRDNDPDRFRAAALLSRMAGLGATFHYEQGLQAKIPTGLEARCFDAWNEAWTLLPANVEIDGAFHEAGQPGSAVAAFDRTAAAAVFERQQGTMVHVLVIDAPQLPRITWSKGWRRTSLKRLGGAWLLTAARVQE
jgi:hypothetical protein